MISEKQHFKREYIFKETQKGLNFLKEQDQFLEAVSIWIKFRKSENCLPFFYPKTLKYLPNGYMLKDILDNALNYAKVMYRKDNSLGLLKIVLRTKINSEKHGEIILIDVTKKNKI